MGKSALVKFLRVDVVCRCSQKTRITNLSISHIRKNPFFNRLQCHLSISTDNGAVDRKTIQTHLSNKLKFDSANIMVYSIKNAFGNRPMTAEAHCYKSQSDMLNNEPQKRLCRQGLKESAAKTKRRDKKIKRRKLNKLSGKAKTAARNA